MASCFSYFNTAQPILIISYSTNEYRNYLAKPCFVLVNDIESFVIIHFNAELRSFCSLVKSLLSSMFLFTDHAPTHCSMFHGIPVTGGVGGGKTVKNNKKNAPIYIYFDFNLSRSFYNFRSIRFYSFTAPANKPELYEVSCKTFYI